MSIKQSEEILNTPYYRKNNAVKILCVKGEPGVKGEAGSVGNKNQKYFSVSDSPLGPPRNKVLSKFHFHLNFVLLVN